MLNYEAIANCCITKLNSKYKYDIIKRLLNHGIVKFISDILSTTAVDIIKGCEVAVESRSVFPYLSSTKLCEYHGLINSESLHSLSNYN